MYKVAELEIENFRIMFKSMNSFAEAKIIQNEFFWKLMFQKLEENFHQNNSKLIFLKSFRNIGCGQHAQAAIFFSSRRLQILKSFC